MSLKRSIIRALDNPAGRPILAWLTTRRARRILGVDVRVRYDRVWTHNVSGGCHIADSLRYEYYDAHILQWAHEVERHLSNAREYWFSQSYEPKSGDVIIDIGAGRGEDVLAFSRAVGPAGKVLAVEAHPVSYKLLVAFCEMNQLRNVIPVNAAVMDQPGSVTIGDAEDWETNTVSRSTEGTIVQATTLDHLCAQYGIRRVEFLKMNIEGAEKYALPGMARTLENIGALCICCHDFRADRGEGEQYRTREFVETFLKQASFQVHGRDNETRLFLRDHVHAKKPDSV